jgi:fructose-1,6-bisphosphatase
LEHDFFAREARTRNTEYSELMQRKNELEEENRELLEYINHDKKRLKVWAITCDFYTSKIMIISDDNAFKSKEQ